VAQGTHSESPSPWSKREGPPSTSKKKSGDHEKHKHAPLGGPIPEDMLRDIAQESSQSERRADEAERELMEWKKVKFMEDRVGEDFAGLIVSVTKFGMFVELNDLFIEGLVPLTTMSDDRYMYHENTRQIIGQRTRKTYSMGDPIHVFVDRIDEMQKRIQFGIVEEARAPKAGKRKTKRTRIV
jgi:ribonuclease R